jgi:flagellar motor switch protein FliN/FliY
MKSKTKAAKSAEPAAIETLLNDLPEAGGDAASAAPANPEPSQARRDLTQMMRKIPVTLTLEVGSARISLQDLMEIGEASIVELDRVAGEPLVIKVNGTAIGHAEVVVSGENYGLKVTRLDGLDLDSLAS